MQCMAAWSCRAEDCGCRVMTASKSAQMCCGWWSASLSSQQTSPTMLFRCSCSALSRLHALQEMDSRPPSKASCMQVQAPQILS